MKTLTVMSVLLIGGRLFAQARVTLDSGETIQARQIRLEKDRWVVVDLNGQERRVDRDAVRSVEVPDTVTEILVRDRLLKLQGTQDSRESAILELVAIGRPAAEALKELIAKHPGSTGREAVLRNAAASALVQIVGPAEAASWCLEHPAIMTNDSLAAFARAAKQLAPDARKQIAQKVAKEIESKDANRQLVALELAAAAFAGEIDPAASFGRLRDRLRDGPDRPLAGWAVASIDRSGGRIEPAIIPCYAEMLRRDELMIMALETISGSYELGDSDRGRRNRKMFEPILFDVVLATLAAHDRMSWAGDQYFFYQAIMDMTRERYDDLRLTDKLVDPTIPLARRKLLVDLVAAFGGRPGKGAVIFPSMLNEFPPAKARRTLVGALPRAEGELKETIYRWYPDLAPKEY